MHESEAREEIDPLDRFTRQAQRDFRASIRPIYRNSARKPRPVHVASCLLLNVYGTPIVCTAAHVADDLREHSLFVAGAVGTGLVHIQTHAVKAAIAPDGNRESDRFDTAIWKPSAPAVAALGAVQFLDASRIASGQTPTDNRLYTAIGYPRSRNKTKANHAAKSIDTRISMYTAGVEAMPGLAAEIGVSGAEHLFLRWQERSFKSGGASENTFRPRGLSGGALLDLGEFASPESYARDPNRSALLSGMVIEYYEEHRALVAVKIGAIINSIRLALRMGRP